MLREESSLEEGQQWDGEMLTRDDESGVMRERRVRRYIIQWAIEEGSPLDVVREAQREEAPPAPRV